MKMAEAVPVDDAGPMSCDNCGDEASSNHDDEHVGLCCDCFDLMCGCPLDIVNEERSRAGKHPLSEEHLARARAGVRLATFDEQKSAELREHIVALIQSMTLNQLKRVHELCGYLAPGAIERAHAEHQARVAGYKRLHYGWDVDADEETVR